MIYAQFALNGLLLGGLYACIAAGFSLVWGVLHIINMLHGAFIVLGASVGWITTPDATIAALDAFMEARGRRGGETVLLRALEALQGERYLRLAEKRPANEAFLYGWLANRIGS